MAATSLGGIPLEKAQDVDSKFTCLIYGASGAGKTTLAASAAEVPDMKPVLFLDVEDGLLSIKDKYEVFRVRTTDMNKIRKVYEELHKAARTGNLEYNTIVIDNMTELQQHGLTRMLDDTDEWDDPEIPEWKTYNKSTEQVRRFIRAWRDLGVNVIFTAHETTEENERTKKERARPYLTKKASEQIPGFVNYVFYIRLRGVDERLLQTTKTENAVAKDRSGRLPPTIKNPTMAIIQDYINGNVSASNDKKES